MFDQLPRERETQDVEPETGDYIRVMRQAEYFSALELTLHPAFHVLEPDLTVFWNAPIFGPSSYLRLNQQFFYSLPYTYFVLRVFESILENHLHPS